MTIGKSAVALVVAALLVYGGIEAYPLLAGPELLVTAPQDGETVPGGIVVIRGHLARSTGLTLNGSPLLRDETGAFSTTLAFPAGTSILTFVAKDRFGRSITKTHTIYVPS